MKKATHPHGPLMPAVIYARSASGSPAQLAGQELVCRRFAQAHSFRVVAVCRDNGRVGKGFDQAVQIGSQRRAVLIIERTDRLGRRAVEALPRISLVHDAGLSVIDAETGFDWSEHFADLARFAHAVRRVVVPR